MLTITYSPELNVWTVHNGKRERIVVAEEFAPGGKLERLALAFEAAKEAVVTGQAIAGIHVNIS